MGTIRKIKLPDNSEHNIQDSRITTANAHVIPFGKCDSTSTSTDFTATVPGITALEDGTCVYLTNGVVTSASGFTLNINSLGALPCYQTMAASSRVTTVWSKNYTFLFVYNSQRVDGGCWDIYYGYANALATTMRTASMTKPMAAAVYRYRILFSSADDKKWVPANTSSSTNATSSRTVCQTPINPFGDIRYYTSTTALAADETPGVSTLGIQYTCTLGYSFNRTGAALTLTANAPVYIKCAPQTNGSAIIDSDTPYVQALPSADDGKIYIFLGVAYSATAVEILPCHPVYYYKNGAVGLWTNPVDSRLFVAECGTTTYAQISAAWSAGKMILVEHNGNLYVPSWEDTSSPPTYFSCFSVEDSCAYWCCINPSDDSWDSDDLAIQSALVSGTDIKTINNTSLLGSGNVNIEPSPWREAGAAGAVLADDPDNETFVTREGGVAFGNAWAMGDITDQNLYISSNAFGALAHGRVYVDASSSFIADECYIKASGQGAHAEGNVYIEGQAAEDDYVAHILASGDGAHAEGFAGSDITGNNIDAGNILAEGLGSHAEGCGTSATGNGSHAEGYKTMAEELASHAEGRETDAANNYAHVEGAYTVAYNEYEHAQGIYNKSNVKTTGTVAQQKVGCTLSSIGIGTANNARANAFEVMQNGDVYIYGIGGYDGTNPNTNGVSTLQTSIPTVPTISTDISSDKSSNTKTASPKAVYDDAHPAVGSSQPAGGMLPNVLYNLGTLTGTVTISFASASDANIENEWKFTFDTSSTAPTITWPNAITAWSGNCLSSNVPNIAASKHYEVSVVGGYALIVEV